MQGEFAFGPVDFQCAEHGQVGSGVCGVGIQQGAIPVKENGPGSESERFHSEGIVSEGGNADKRLAIIESDWYCSSCTTKDLTQTAQRKACRIRRAHVVLSRSCLREFGKGAWVLCYRGINDYGIAAGRYRRDVARSHQSWRHNRANPAFRRPRRERCARRYTFARCPDRGAAR